MNSCASSHDTLSTGNSFSSSSEMSRPQFRPAAEARKVARVVAHDRLPLPLRHVVDGDLEVLLDLRLLRRSLRRRPSPCRTSPSADARTSSGRLWSRSRDRVGRFTAFAADGRLPARSQPFLVQVGQEHELHLGVRRQASGGRRDRAASAEPPAGSGPGPSATGPCRCASRIMASGSSSPSCLAYTLLDGRQQFLAQLRLIRKLAAECASRHRPGSAGRSWCPAGRWHPRVRKMLTRKSRAFFALSASCCASCSLPSAMPFCCSASRYFHTIAGHAQHRQASSTAASSAASAGRRRTHLPPAPAAPPAAPGSARPPGTAAGRPPAPRRWHSAAPAPCSGTSGRSSPGRAAPSAARRDGGTGSSRQHLTQRLDVLSAPRTAAGPSGTRTGTPPAHTRRPPVPCRATLPAACSGAMYDAVPMIAPDLLTSRASSSMRLARPKSVIFGVPLGRQQDVARLQVAMHHATQMGVVHRPRQRLDQPGRLPRRRPLASSAARRACRRRRTPARRTAGRAPRRPRGAARCSGAASAPPLPSRSGSAAARAAPACSPARIIFRATRRLALSCRAW